MLATQLITSVIQTPISSMQGRRSESKLGIGFVKVADLSCINIMR